MQSNDVFKNLIKTGSPSTPRPPGDGSGFKQEIEERSPPPLGLGGEAQSQPLERTGGGGQLLARTEGESGPQTLRPLQEYALPSPSPGVCLPGCVSVCVCIALYKQKLTHIGAASDPGQGAGRGHISNCNTFRATYIWKKLSHCVMKPYVSG